MSRYYSQYNKNDTYLANLNYANQQKERKNREELKEIEQDRIAMEKLQLELDKEKQLEKERKNQIRQQQYADYSNYVRQKYSEVPQTKDNNINIKLGNENRYIRKPSYQQQMENLCLNPTKNQNIYAQTPVTNFSEMGRRNQRGYSHGYNILTGEVYSSEPQQGKTSKNLNINNNNSNIKEPIQNNYRNNNNNFNNNDIEEKEKEDLRQYQEYMEMKRKKEQEEQEQAALYYIQQQESQNKLRKEKEQVNENLEKFQNIPNQELNYKNNEYNPQEQLYDKEMRQNPENINIPPEYKDIYNKENLQSNQIKEQVPSEEIPPEYREMYMREQLRDDKSMPQYHNKQEEINAYKQKENENIINKEKNNEDEYRKRRRKYGNISKYVKGERKRTK